MSAGPAVPDPGPRELRAVGLAALAEAGIVAIPAFIVLETTGALHLGIWAFSLSFTAVYVVGTLLLCRFRASPRAPLVAAIAVILLGVRFGWGAGPYRLFFILIVSLLVTIRVVTLALRDWRVPYDAEIAWFALALGLEVIIPVGSFEDWKPVLVVVVPVFFIAALASRATTVWTTAAPRELDDSARADWLRRSLVATGGLLIGMAAAVALGVKGGLLERVGALLAPVARSLAVLLTWVLLQLARPLIWLVERIQIDPEAARRFLERLRRNASELDRRIREPGSPTVWLRLLGLAVIVLAVVGLVRLIRRIRPRASADARVAEAPVSVTTSALEVEEPLPSRPWYRREMPEDRVRRRYAESLLELERLRLPKDPALTPAEFAPQVARAFPSCAEGFRELTRAYEDVRYGNLALDPRGLRRTEEQAEGVLAVLKKARPLAEDDLRRSSEPDGLP